MCTQLSPLHNVQYHLQLAFHQIRHFIPQSSRRRLGIITHNVCCCLVVPVHWDVCVCISGQDRWHSHLFIYNTHRTLLQQMEVHGTGTVFCPGCIVPYTYDSLSPTQKATLYIHVHVYVYLPGSIKGFMLSTDWVQVCIYVHVHMYMYYTCTCIYMYICSLVSEGGVQGGLRKQESHNLQVAQLTGIVEWCLTNLCMVSYAHMRTHHTHTHTHTH